MWSTNSPIANRAPLLPIAVCLAIGITMGVSFPFLYAPLSVFFVFSGLVIICFFCNRKPYLQTCLIFACTALLGLLLAGRQQAHTDRLLNNREQIMEAVVISEPAEKAKTWAVQILLYSTGQDATCYLQKDERSSLLKPGDGLLIKVRLKKGLYNRLQCYVASRQWQRKYISPKQLSLTDRTRITFLKWRHSLLERYKMTGASHNVYAVLAAMTLGDKSALDKELRDTYSVTGASHVLALSGLHISIVYLLLSFLTFRRRQWRIYSQVLTVLAIWAFALLTGLSVSIVRSALMISLFALFSLGKRPHLSINLLALAAIIILLQAPLTLFDIGFQLSFMAVLSILLFMPLTEGKERVRKRQDIRKAITRCLWISLAAQIGTAPLIAFYFGRFPTYFLLTNLVVLPATYLILLGSLLMLLIPPFSVVVVRTVECLNYLLSFIAKLPMASLEGLHPSIVEVLLCYLCTASLYGAILVWQNKWYRSYKTTFYM